MKKLVPTVLLALVALTGCASTAVKSAVGTLQQSHTAYGAVMEVQPANSDVNRTACAKGATSRNAGLCADLKAYSEVKVAFLHRSRIVTGIYAVPNKWDVPKGAIVEIDPAGNAIAKRVAAQTPRADCMWTGHSLDDLTSRTGMAKGFALGLLIVPAVVIAADDSILEGGVECDGWSYKELLKASASN